MILDQLFDLKSKVIMMSSGYLLPNFISVPCISTKPLYSKANSYVLQEQELQDPNKDLRKKVTSMTLKHLCVYICIYLYVKLFKVVYTHMFLNVLSMITGTTFKLKMLYVSVFQYAYLM
jgi:hypothetical protein